MNWHEAPFLRFLPFFVVGIVSASLLDAPPIAAASGGMLFISLCFLVLLRSPRTEHRKRWRFGLACFLALLFFGYCLGYLHIDLRRPQHFSGFARGEDRYFLGKVIQVRPGEKTDRLELEILGVGFPDSIPPRYACGRLVLYLKRDTVSAIIAPGAQVAFLGSVRPFDPPLNPKAFDYGRYMRKKGFYYQCYADPGRFKVLVSPEITAGWQLRMDRLRKRCIRIFAHHLPESNDFGFAAALVLGYRDGVNDETYSAYAETGAIHVLAVSGLHVGLVYLGLGFALRFLNRKKWQTKLLKGLLTLAGIWLFAVFTGASPSALRAAAMFSFMITGRIINRHGNIYNTLAASAFCLLCIDPGLISETGFQLSYLAVTGIVFFQGPVFKLWYISNALGRFAWKLNSVSLGAQLTTFPLTLYLFHQFPVYFWLSGLIVIPMATLILPAGIALLFLDAVPLIGDGLGWLLRLLVGVTNMLIFQVHRLPGGLISGIWPGVPGLLVSFLITGCLMRAVARDKSKPILWGLAMLAVTGLWINLCAFRDANERELIIYQIPGHSAVDLLNGNEGIYLGDLPWADPRLEQAAGNYRAFRRIRVSRQLGPADSLELTERSFFKMADWVQFYSYRLYLLDHLPDRPPAAPPELDLLLVSGNPAFDPLNMPAFFKPAAVVLDGSNTRRTADRWANACKQLNIPCHYTARDGAFIKHL